ncbi:Ankyrin repeat-containing protein [Brazilian cedratvirus IHUMI]|uniref:Ankyrin repeat-containing protein n=1 Tax=Brazilian cedratvirus IHUMI TaxID=2126980 RepID=A0A2R8FFP2_9VIRU|nr:Ankyrin repeat-containing protein [Brazilian cedratvirus IHUMI]
MQIVYQTIFSYCGGYNYLNGQVCKEFSLIAPKVCYLRYLDDLLGDEKEICLSPSCNLLELAFEKELLHLLGYNKHLISADHVSEVTGKGKLKILKWFKDNGYSIDEHIFSIAATSGQHEVMCWLREINCPYDKDKMCSDLAHGGDLEFLKWARSEGCPWGEDFCSNAAFSGHLQLLQWAVENGHSLDTWICSSAAEGGQLEVLQWAHSQGCFWDSNTCFRAAHKGHLEVLKWLHQNGCPWTSGVCSAAAAEGYLEILQWARSQGCDWSEQVYVYAIDNDRLEIVEWACANGCPLTPNIFNQAIIKGNLQILQILKDGGGPPQKTFWNRYMLADALSNGDLRVLDWLKENGNFGEIFCDAARMSKTNSEDVLEWLFWNGFV